MLPSERDCWEGSEPPSQIFCRIGWVPNKSVGAPAHNSPMGEVAALEVQRSGSGRIEGHQDQHSGVDGDVHNGVVELWEFLDATAEDVSGQAAQRRVANHGHGPAKPGGIDGPDFILQYGVLNQITDRKEKYIQENDKVEQEPESVGVKSRQEVRLD